MMLILINLAVFEGIEEPDKNILLHETCRYVAIRICHGSSITDTSSVARIITHAPLRAKDASPFVSNKYPVVVCISDNSN